MDSIEKKELYRAVEIIEGILNQQRLTWPEHVSLKKAWALVKNELKMESKDGSRTELPGTVQ